VDSTLITIHALVACLLLAGLAGSILPFLPGTPLIFLGALVHALATDFSPISAGRLLVLAGLTVLAYLLEYAGGALEATKFGGSAWAVVGRWSARWLASSLDHPAS
jgi:uncharacterized protein YqgC (DUF456 family)